jgi:hypothetical protein
VRFYGLTTLALVPLRDTPAFKPLFVLARLLDRAVFAIPGLRWYAWFSVIRMTA